MNKAKRFRLGVDLVPGHGGLERGLRRVDALIHERDGADSDGTKNPHGEHDFY